MATRYKSRTFTWTTTGAYSVPTQDGTFIDDKTQDEGPPYSIQGKSASDLEWRVYQAFKEIGIQEQDIQFQVSFYGGQMLPGGMVLDFIVRRWPESIPIEIEGQYWHEGEKRTSDEFKRARLFEEQGWLTPLVTITESEIMTDDMAVSVVRDKIGM